MSLAKRRDSLHAPSKTKRGGDAVRRLVFETSNTAKRRGGLQAACMPASRRRSQVLSLRFFASLFTALFFATRPALTLEAKPTPKIVSLAPSNTELLLDIGAEKTLAGVSTNCNQVIPNAAERLKGIPITGTFVTANLERLTRVKPDVVLLVSGQETIEALLKHRGFKVAVLKNDKLADIPGNLRKVGELSGKQKRADLLADNFEERLWVLNVLLNDASKKPKVFYCTWAQPLLTIGKTSFLNEVVTACGGINIAGGLAQPYPHFSVERLLIADPDIIILPYDAKKQELLKRFPWNKLRAVRENRLFYSPDPKDDMLSRPTMGVLEGLYWLSVRIHPELKPQLDNWHVKVKSRILDIRAHSVR